MFTARSVPNMYLFGTFSAENAPEIAPLLPPSQADGVCPVGSRGRLPLLRAQGALALAGAETGPPSRQERH